MKEVYLYKPLAGKKVQCLACNHRCKISSGKRGICGIRENVNGELYLLTYGIACAENIDPVEKKPLYHFLPETQTLTIATVGCNFRCRWCQNYDISQAPKDLTVGYNLEISGFSLPPEKVVEDALKNNCPSISYSYTEPTVWMDYALDVMKLAKAQGLKNIWVSNGYMSEECLQLISPYLDAANIDIKSINKDYFQKFVGAIEPQRVLDNCHWLYKHKIHLEITTLIVPTVNDSSDELTKIAQFIKNKLSPQIPWHLSRYFPAYKMVVGATPIKTLQKAQAIARKVGLKKVYLGNI